MSNDGKMEKYMPYIIIGIMYIFWAYPVISPFLVPIPIGEKATRVYEFTENIPQGSYILMSNEYSAVSLPLFEGFAQAFLREVWAKDCKVVFVGFGEQSPMMYQLVKKNFITEFNKHEYGVDYIHLGFIPGGESAVAAFCANIRGTVSTDFDRNQPIDSYPIMQGINEVTDFYCVIDSTSEGTLQEGFIRQISFPYEVPLIIVTSGGSQLEPYYPDNIQGLMYPMPQTGAEFESLVGIAGPSIAQIAILFAGSLYIILCIILGTLNYWRTKL
jgi:hypothetical protein